MAMKHHETTGFSGWTSGTGRNPKIGKAPQDNLGDEHCHWVGSDIWTAAKNGEWQTGMRPKGPKANQRPIKKVIQQDETFKLHLGLVEFQYVPQVSSSSPPHLPTGQNLPWS